MTVAFSNDAWGDYAQHWPRMKRELLNVVDLRMRHLAEAIEHEPTGANYFPVPFRNDSGETVPAYGVMRVTGVEFLAGVPLITVAKPSTTFQRLYLVNGPMQVSGASNQDKRGFGTWLNDAGFVLYDDSNTPAHEEEWGPAASSWEIAKYRYGFLIAGGATGGSTDLVAATQRRVTHILGKADSSIASGASGTVSIYNGNQVDTTDNITATNRTEITAGASTWVRCVCLGGTWFLEPWECP